MASAIHQRKESVLSEHAFRFTRCQSMSDLKGSRFFLSDVELKLRFNYVIWAALQEHSRRALEKQEKESEVGRFHLIIVSFTQSFSHFATIPHVIH